MHADHGDLMKSIVDTGNYDSDIESTFKTAIETFKSTQAW
jgi:F-type H+-transporting ATPase subunit alpha